jgi:hypothetical protein
MKRLSLHPSGCTVDEEDGEGEGEEKCPSLTKRRSRGELSDAQKVERVMRWFGSQNGREMFVNAMINVFHDPVPVYMVSPVRESQYIYAQIKCSTVEQTPYTITMYRSTDRTVYVDSDYNPFIKLARSMDTDGRLNVAQLRNFLLQTNITTDIGLLVSFGDKLPADVSNPPRFRLSAVASRILDIENPRNTFLQIRVAISGHRSFRVPDNHWVLSMRVHDLYLYKTMLCLSC